MAAPIEKIVDMASSDEEICIVEATVATGFEPVARNEAEEKLCVKAKECNKGRISMEVPMDRVDKVIELGCVDHCRVVLKHIPDFGFTDDQNDNLLRLRHLVGDVNWPLGLKVWRKFFSFEHPILDNPPTPVTFFGDVTLPPPRQNQLKKSKKSKQQKRMEKRLRWKEENDKKKKAQSDSQTGDMDAQNKEDVKEDDNCNTEQLVDGNKIEDNIDSTKSTNCITNSGDTDSGSEPKKPRVRENPWNPMMPSFRVTCNRHGDNHNFDSMTAAANMGGAIYLYHGWNVKMTEFDIEVILNIEDQEVSVCIGLTKSSLHQRNIQHFGPTTLRPTIAYSMLRLCEMKPGDIVCDPMCGSGSIPIQCALSWRDTFNICGDVGRRCMMRTKDNMSYMAEQQACNKKQLLIDPVRWDVNTIPLRDQSVDVFITDPPFGLRLGSKTDNRKLYPSVLMEMARVVRPSSGRACLITEDKKCMIKTLQNPTISKYWLRTRTLGINMGGLMAGVYVLARTKAAFTREATPKISYGNQEQATGNVTS